MTRHAPFDGRAAARRVRVDTEDGRIEADNVVLATGPYQSACPRVRRRAAADVVQVHSSRVPQSRRSFRPARCSSSDRRIRLPDRGGPARRRPDRVYLSVGRHRRVPRRYRGRDIFWWLQAIGRWTRRSTSAPTPADRPTRWSPGPAAATTSTCATTPSRRDAAGARARRRATTRLHCDDDLAARFAKGDAGAWPRFGSAAVETHIARARRRRPSADGRARPPARPLAIAAPSSICARPASRVVWATGFARTSAGSTCPCFDAAGEPVHRRGVSPCAGRLLPRPALAPQAQVVRCCAASARTPSISPSASPRARIASCPSSSSA